MFARTGDSWMSQGKLTASVTTSGELFGNSVALSADTALIGIGSASGNAAYVFTRSGSTWSQQAKLTDSVPAANAYFGWSVALSGDTALIGAYGDVSNSGTAFVFTRSGTAWTVKQNFFAKHSSPGNRFGYSVALSGDVALIGARTANCTTTVLECGFAEVFTRLTTTFKYQAQFTASDAAANDHFGHSVALSMSGNTVLIGAPSKDCSSGATVINCGAAYVFINAGNSWVQRPKLTALDTVTGDRFGNSVAVSDTTAVIGADGNDDGGADSGSAYVFTASGSTWTELTKLTASDAAANDLFGASVALSGNTILVGAKGDACSAGSACGSAYPFNNSSGSWAERPKLTAVKTVVDKRFGFSVALSGDTALIGAYWDDCSTTILDCGSAFVFTRSGSAWSQQQKLTASDAAAYDYFGYSVALSADTALIGAYKDDCSTTILDCGSAYVFTRSSNSWTQQQKITASDSTASDTFGTSVALLVDTALIGAGGADCSAVILNCGSAYVFTRTGITWLLKQKLTAFDAAADDSFGNSVALSGDTVLVGAPYDDDGGTDSGSTYVFTRTGSTWSLQQKLHAFYAAANEAFGNSVALSGDTALIGAPGYQGAYVFTRTGSNWLQQQKLTASDAANGDGFGQPVALFGDTALIGASGASCVSGSWCGAAYVFIRSGSGWSEQQKLTASDAANGDRFGYSVALSADTALIGAPLASDAAYLHYFPCAYGSGLLASRWTMIGIPCDPGAANTVQDIFGDNLNPSRYGSRWVIYKRDPVTDAYSLLNLSSPMAQGKGYWILTHDATVWDVSGTETLRDTSNPNCVSVDGCYVIDLTPPGPGGLPRFNLIGHTFSFNVDWASVRIEVNGTAYTPGAAKTAGYMEKDMWIYNSNGYDVFDDTTPGMEGTLTPQGSIWVAVLNGAAGKTIKLLIPARNPSGSPPPPPPPTIP